MPARRGGGVAGLIRNPDHEPRTVGRTLEVVGGDTLIADAVRRVAYP